MRAKWEICSMYICIFQVKRTFLGMQVQHPDTAESHCSSCFWMANPTLPSWGFNIPQTQLQDCHTPFSQLPSHRCGSVLPWRQQILHPCSLKSFLAAKERSFPSTWRDRMFLRTQQRPPTSWAASWMSWLCSLSPAPCPYSWCCSLLQLPDPRPPIPEPALLGNNSPSPLSKLAISIPFPPCSLLSLCPGTSQLQAPAAHISTFLPTQPQFSSPLIPGSAASQRRWNIQRLQSVSPKHMQMDLFEKPCILAKFRCFVMQMEKDTSLESNPSSFSFSTRFQVFRRRGVSLVFHGESWENF